MAEDVLAGITDKTTKADLLSRLRDAARRLHGQEDDRVARMQQIEETVRAKFSGQQVTVKSVTLMSTEEEFSEMIDFLENFTDIMPIAMHRLLAGAQAVTGKSQV